MLSTRARGPSCVSFFFWLFVLLCCAADACQPFFHRNHTLSTRSGDGDDDMTRSLPARPPKFGGNGLCGFEKHVGRVCCRSVMRDASCDDGDAIGERAIEKRRRRASDDSE